MEKKFNVNGEEVLVQDFIKDQSGVSFTLKGKKYSFSVVQKDNGEMILQGSHRFKAQVSKPNREGDTIVMAMGREGTVSVAGRKIKKAAASGSLTSPMPGKIFKIVKEVGAEVSKGETILILEAMKMEHSIRADKDGKVKKIMFKTGELVQGGVTLVEVE